MASAEAELRIGPLELRTQHVFGLSRSSEQRFHNLVARVLWDGAEGWGEAAPSAYYGENADLARVSLPLYWSTARERIPELLDSEDPFELLLDLHRSWDTLLRRNGAARAALDMALWDLWGRSRGVSVGPAWHGSSTDCPVTSYTIAIDSPETLEEKLEAASAFGALKVKLGGPRDLETLRRARAGTFKPIRVDANCAWSGSEAVRRLEPLVELGIEMIEQPCRPNDLEGLAEVRRAFGVPVYADESAETLDDLEALPGRVDGINVKLVKSGGPTRALCAVRRARELGLEVMLGCMIESSLGITAAAHLAPLADRLDLDGALLLEHDPFEGVRWSGEGRPVLPATPGLGVRLAS